jgi:hypothetical protein
MAATYIVYNSADATTASAVKQPTGTSIRTMLQLAPNVPIKIFEWGCSFDGDAAATPGQVELIDTGTVPATVTTAFAVNDVQTFVNYDSPANGSGTAGTPLGLGTTYSGFATASTTEGSYTAPTRMGDLQLLPPTSPYLKQMPLGREFYVPAGHFLHVRANFGTSVNMYCYVLFETA